MSYLKNYLENVFEIENFFVEEDATKILEKFKKNSNWRHIVQNKPQHYSHVFKNDSDYTPSESETYLATFWKNIDLSEDEFIKEKTTLAVRSYFYEIYKIKDLEIDIRCHKFEKNDFLRIHTDGYAGGYFHLTHVGGSRTFNIDQESTSDNDWLKITSAGSSGTVCVTQSDATTSFVC
mgnify:CR=1 FL=1